MNKLILSLFVVVCVAAVNAKVLKSNEALYAIEDDQVGLEYPGACQRRTLVRYARDCKLMIARRWNGYCVRDSNTNVQITVIPWIVRPNERCRKVINALTARCEGSTTTTTPVTTTETYRGEKGPEYYGEMESEYYGEEEYYQ
ncbi:uncharacterized protein LOC127869212 [Dreissena polymorpha]|uniref:Uncharacterized protein n=1 Tax=Dreissena polymorpha TaxID=45954 RepID=A0A9D4MDX9_DREPO|nr:uncharacterized protein LOC127869212 [Dreissena polymorpha]KAH3874390.1 hypothetical protein DPMN_037632 [Dreissena polymorpha]